MQVTKAMNSIQSYHHKMTTNQKFFKEGTTSFEGESSGVWYPPLSRENLGREEEHQFLNIGDTTKTIVYQKV